MMQRNPFRRIGVDDAEHLMRQVDVLLFDVRDAASFASGHIGGAQHLSTTNLSAVIQSAARSKPIVIYCYHGNASREYAQIFSDFGFATVCSVDGGYEAWSNHLRAAEPGPLDESLRQWLTAHGFPSDGINATIANGTTPLMKAAHEGRVDAIRRLVAAGARLDARNADDNNALWLACVGNSLDAIDALVGSGIDINNRNDNGATPLMYAASSGKADVVERLLARGADTTLETLDGFTALDTAATVACLTLLRRATRLASDSHGGNDGLAAP